MIYFDCFCEVGPRNDKDPAAPWSVTDVLHWMDHCGIAGALVVHTLSIHNDPVDARGKLAAAVACAPDRLFPAWTVLPPHAGDFEATPDEFLDAMAENDVHAVKLCPEAHAYPLVGPVMGPMLATLEEKKTLTMLNVAGLGNEPKAIFDGLDALLAAYPNLPILLQQHNWGMQRVILPLMEQYKNLHIEFSSYQVNRGIEEYVKRFGPDRLLFGTGLPAMSAGAARAYIDYARVSDEAKEKIACGNLSRLLGGITPEPAPAREPDALRDPAAAGQPITDSPVLNAHCHVLHERGSGAGRVVMLGGDADGIVEIEDVVGVRKTAIMSWSGAAASEFKEGNDIVARAVARHPGRLVGVVYVNPAQVSKQDIMREMSARIEGEGFVGVKPYHRVGLRYDDPLYTPCWEYINERGLYALLHLMNSVTGGVEVVDKLAEKYPDAQWLAAHTGGRWPLARGLAEVMKKRPNVWAEITYTTVTNNILEWMVSEVGDDRILFGTDSPMRDPRPQFGWVVWADLPEESRRKILGKNFERVLAMGKNTQRKSAG